MKYEARKGPRHSDHPLTEDQRTEQFVRLLGKNQQRVYSFILTLVPHWADADEVLQETNTVLWQKFADFQPGSDFVRWANQVAFYEVLKFRRHRKKDVHYFSDAFVKEVAAEAMEMTDILQMQRDCLANCLTRLSERDRTLVQLRYQDDLRPRRVAQRLGRSTDSVYKSLRRVRRMLLDCVHRMMAAEERT